MIGKSVSPLFKNRNLLEQSTDNDYIIGGNSTHPDSILFYCGFSKLNYEQQVDVLTDLMNIKVGGIIAIPMFYNRNYDHLIQPTDFGTHLTYKKVTSISVRELYRLCLVNGFEVLKPVLFGSWSGYRQPNQPGLDIVVIRRSLPIKNALT
jgi:hypothetical protein